MKVCKVEGCERKGSRITGYCTRHYEEIKKHGKIINNVHRTRLDPNEFIIEGQICKIQHYDKYGYVKGESIIDLDDFGKVKDYKWCQDSQGYMSTYSKGFGHNRRVKIHHMIMNHKQGRDIEVDHLDGDKLNNRKSNLRFCTQKQNSRNSIMSKNNTSGYKGVVFCKDRTERHWKAQIYVNYRNMHMGYFDSRIEAARAYNKAAFKYHGRFASINRNPGLRRN